MAGETILVVDAGQDLDQRITTVLEAKGFLVVTESSPSVNAQIAETIGPSLIYVKPLELSAEGFKPCKAIHDIPLLRNVPIVILASLKGPLDPRYATYYGIVDFLNPTFGPDELIGKTGEILGETPPSQLHREDASASAESAGYAKGAPRTTAKESPLSRTLKAMGKKRSSFLLPAIGAAILLVIAGAGFLIYQQLMPARKAPASSALIVRSPVPSKAPEVESKPQVPPERKVPDASAPVLPKPSTPPPKAPSLSLATSQPPGKHFYSVQLGAFKNEGTAEALMKEFREKGYEAFIQPGVTKDKSPIYRVLVSKHENRKAAEKLAGEIRSKENTNAVLYAE